VLISTGLLMFAFVAYQLWGTGIQTAQAQSKLTSQFDELLSGTTTIPVTVPPTTVPTDTVPANTTPDATTTTTTVPVALTAPSPGAPVAKLEIPRIDMDGTIVVEGVEPDDLTRGPGHFPETPLPGQLGNAAIAGHRTSHGQPFYRIDEMQVGDPIIVTTLAGRFTYLVTGTRIVGRDDYDLVIPTVDPTIATLTITSCHPRFSTSQRIVVTSLLDPTASNVAQAPPPTTTPTTVPVTTIPGDTVPVSTVATGGEPPVVAPPVVEVPAVDAPAGAQVFENRWFSDKSAFWPVALWGLLLSIISIGAWQLSRRTGRNLIGFAAGVVPFVLVLYFFFENVSRLLPPNL
jgi:sortase A